MKGFILLYYKGWKFGSFVYTFLHTTMMHQLLYDYNTR
jgi:hypothetical protein